MFCFFQIFEILSFKVAYFLFLKKSNFENSTVQKELTHQKTIFDLKFADKILGKSVFVTFVLILGWKISSWLQFKYHEVFHCDD